MCTVTYLSFAPHGIREAFITGGLPGLTATADDIYRHSYRTVAAAVYYNDMYVDRELSMQTAQAIRGLQAWVTSEYEHDGLRVSNGAVLDRLIGMARGNI